MKLISKLLVVLAVIVSGAASPILAGENDPLFISLTANKIQPTNHALHFGKVHFTRGHPLTIFLSGRAVSLATRAHAGEYAVQQKSMAELMDKGAVVIVCRYCMKQQGIKETELLPGYKVGNPDLVGGALFRENTKTISW